MKSFSPTDTETSFWVRDCENLEVIIERAQEKWGDTVDLGLITITPHHIQERSIGYDLYDSSDYGDYIEVSIRK